MFLTTLYSEFYPIQQRSKLSFQSFKISWKLIIALKKHWNEVKMTANIAFELQLHDKSGTKINTCRDSKILLISCRWNKGGQN